MEYLFDLKGIFFSSELENQLRQMLSEGQKPEDAAFAINKSLLADFMRENKIDSVVVEYSGSGDSGGVDSVTFCIGDRQVDTPQGRLSLLFVERRYRKNGDEIKFTTFDTGVENAFERMIDDALDMCGNKGWENNAGGYGVAHFTLENPRDEAVEVKITHNTYIIEVETDEYDL